MNRFDRHQGFVLLPVVLAITLIAVIAFMLNNQSAINVDVTAGVTDAVKAEHVARAGLAHTTWGAQNSGCAGDRTMTTVPFGQAGTGSYTATIKTPGGTTTPYSLTVDQDAWIREGNPTQNNGGDNTLLVINDPGDSKYALYRFDLSSIPAGAQINSATAWFYVEQNDDEGSVNLHRVTTAWTEADATWASMGDRFEDQVMATIPPQPNNNVWVQVNLTPLVQAWVNGGLPNDGILLKATSAAVGSIFSSSESGASQQPRLEVVVGTGPASPVILTANGTLAGNPSPANDITRSLARTDVPAYQPPGTLLLQPGPEGKDARIYQWKYAWNYGASNSLTAEAWPPDSDTRSLLQFNLDSIPHGARIHSASLALHQNSNAASGGPFGVHRITSDWVEGSGNGGTAPGVTWNERDTGTPWTTPGGDMDTNAHAITTIPAGTQGWFSWDITGLVDGWVNGRYPNHGLALIPEATNNNNAYFESSDAGTASLRPKLTITYACECGSTCLAPQGSGNVLMVVSDDLVLTNDEVIKKALFESWGYTVNLINDNVSAGGFLSVSSTSDVVYISESVVPSTLGTKVTGLTIGIVNEQGALNDALGISNFAGVAVGASVNVVDTTHYITAPFPSGVLDIYSAAMEMQGIFNGPAPDLQTLASIGTSPSLAVLEKGATLKGGATAAGRRVALPLGREARFNWDYLNANGLLMVQRALQWGTGNTGEPPKNLLLVVVDPASLTAQEAAKKALIESWGYAVNSIDDDDSQANFDAAIAANDVAYIPQDINSTNLGTKLANAAIGVVNEEGEQVDELGFAQDKLFKDRTEIDVLDNSHYITQPFATGLLTFVSSTQSVHMLAGQIAPGLQTLGQTNNVGSQYEPSLATLDAGDEVYGGGNAAGRRVELPWGGGTFDVAALNADGQTIMQRAIEWAEGAGSVPAPGLNVLLVVGDAVTLSSKDTGYKALMESWGHTVTLIDDGDSQANFDAAAAANDVVYVSGSSSGPSLLDKLTNTTTGLVNEVNGKIDNFGFSSSTTSTVSDKTFTTTAAAHYITEPFSGNPVDVFGSNKSMPVPGGTLAPDLQNVGEVTGIPSLVTLDTGATGWSGSPVPARRAHLPFTAAETTDMTTDGQTIMQRTLEWAAGADAGTTTILLSSHDTAELGGLTFTAADLVEYNSATDTATLYFDGANLFSDPLENVQSAYVLANGHIILSTRDNATLGGLSFTQADLVDYDPATDTAILFFNGAALFSDTLTRISSAQVLANGHIILSTWSDATLGGLTFTPAQLVAYDPVSDTAWLYFDGTALFGDPLDRIVSMHVLANKHIVLSTWGTNTLGGLSFGEGDLVEYDPVSDTATMYFEGTALFTDPLEKLVAAHIKGDDGPADAGGGGGGGPTGVVFEEFTEAALSNGTSLVIDKPNGTSSGDLLIAAVATDGNTVGSLAPPAGWNVVDLTTQGGAVTFAVWWKLAGASESSTYTFTWSGNEHAYGWIIRFTGHDPATPIHMSSNSGETSGSPVSPSVTTTVNDTMILRLGGFDDDDITTGDPGLSGHTAINMGDSGNGPSTASGGSGYVLQPTAGASGTSNFTLTGTEEARTVTISIAPAP